MALTLDHEQKLNAVGLVLYFDEDKQVWLEIAKKAYEFVKGNFPADSVVRTDDVAKALLPIIEVHEGLRDELNESKLTQKYWIAYFTDLVIDRCWAEISQDGETNDQAAVPSAKD